LGDAPKPPKFIALVTPVDEPWLRALNAAPQSAKAALGRRSSRGSTGGTDAAQVALPQSPILRPNAVSTTG
jgi:hypothetical protein